MTQPEQQDMEATLNMPVYSLGSHPAPDKLLLRDKVPLALALVAQSYVVFLWYLRSTHGVHPYVDFFIALAAGIALDWLTVSTVMGRREGRTSIWSWLTSFGAFIASAMIAYDTYADQWWPLNGQALLHICFPLVVLLYSLHLASPKRFTNSKAIYTHPVAATPLIDDASGYEEPSRVRSASEAVPVTTNTIYVCPACGGNLDNIGELGAAKRWGHCRHCKGKTTIPLHQPVESSKNGAGPE